MKILVVDDKPDSAAALAQSLRETTNFEVHSATGGQQALEVARDNGLPDVLITEVVMEGMDGFSLRESLRAERPNLRTVYLTDYDVSGYQEFISGSPVFYKPADPQSLLAALEPPPEGRPLSETSNLPADARSQSARLRRLVAKQGFTGKLDQFELVDIIQMCCVSNRTGCLQIARRHERGVIYLQNGQIIHAVSGALAGAEAVYEIIGWSNGQFNFAEGVQPGQRTIEGGGWERLVMEGVRRRDERQQAQTGAAPPADPALDGQTIGPYRLCRKLGQGERVQIFEAVQTSMERTVALHVLRPEFQGNAEIVAQFTAEASAKANVQHPSILAVYEAGEEEGMHYYAREFVDGESLGALRAEGRTIDDAAALQLVRVAAEALGYLSQRKIPSAPLTPDDLYLGRDRHPRLNNLAMAPDAGHTPPATQQDMRVLSRMVTDCLPDRAPASPELRALFGRMLLVGAAGFLSWAALIQAIRALEPKAQPGEALRLSSQRTASTTALLQAASRRQRRVGWYVAGGAAAGLLAVAATALVFYRAPRAPAAEGLGGPVAVPAGEFVYQDGQKITLPAFWIDQHEVTIGEYAQFVEALKARPTNAYEHRDVPRNHHHDNSRWVGLYRAALARGQYNGSPVDLRCPAVFVDWFDAYAYAKWKDRRLPTEQEWEKAARGADGRRFPWGADPMLINKVNTNADFHPDKPGGGGGEADGFSRWAPAGAMTGDRSVFGALDLAGNVREWTATQARRDHPAVRGGSFSSPDVESIRRSEEMLRTDSAEDVGFRTASDTVPAPMADGKK